MSSRPHNFSLLKSPSRKRARESEAELRLAKRRRSRSSISSGLILRTELASPAEGCENDSIETTSSHDRFLPMLTTTVPFYNLNSTNAQSARLARAFGLIQPRLLSFQDDTLCPPLAHHLSDPTLPMRIHLSQSLISEAKTASTNSAAKNGKTKPERVLDSGPMDGFPLHPCAWSRKDVIAAVIQNSVFMHDTENDRVSALPGFGGATCVEWTSDTDLAVGGLAGEISLHDASTGMLSNVYIPQDIDYASFLFPPLRSTKHAVNTMSWNPEQRVLAVGRKTGEVTYIDLRAQGAIRNDTGPAKRFVTNVRWSPDGLFLASGHRSGIVRCMDWRANKAFELCMPQENKAHELVARSLSWAPWNHRLLATGGGMHDHTVRIWSISGGSSCSGPLHTLPVSSSISSLHFSPHATELLSTHGDPAILPSRSQSWRSRRRPSSKSTTLVPASKFSVTQHSIMVHTYPSFEPVHAVQNAHTAPIVDSVLSPDGTRIMTFGEDETLRQWAVWGSRKPEKTLNIVDRLTIR